MAYQANIPQASDKISKSQADLLGNFQSIGTNLFTGSNLGMPAITPPASLAGVVQMFSQTSTLTLQSEFAIQKPTGSTAPINAYEITSAKFSGTVGGNNPGWTRFASGILVLWNGGSATGGLTKVSFPGAPFPGFLFVYSVIIIPVQTGAIATDPNRSVTLFNTGANPVDATGFWIWSDQRVASTGGAPTAYGYVAIGV